MEIRQGVLRKGCSYFRCSYFRHSYFVLWLSLWPLLAAAQNAPPAPGLQEVLDRLDRLEKANRALTDEIVALRRQLATPLPTPGAAASAIPGPDTYVPERVEVLERRVEE